MEIEQQTITQFILNVYCFDHKPYVAVCVGRVSIPVGMSNNINKSI